MKKKIAAKKQSTDMKGFAKFIGVALVVVGIAMYPWILAIAAFLAIALYFTNPRFKSWINGKLKIKNKHDEKADFSVREAKTTMKQKTVSFDEVTTSQLIAELTKRGQINNR